MAMAMLDLAYDATIPRGLLREMESAAKRAGLPLGAIEALGQSVDRCRAFVRAARVHDLRAMKALAEHAEVATMRAPALVAMRARAMGAN
jgi:hypothetical protein